MYCTDDTCGMGLTNDKDSSVALYQVMFACIHVYILRWSSWVLGRSGQHGDSLPLGRPHTEILL